MMAIVPLPRRFYETMIVAFLEDHREWQGSPDLTHTFVKTQHDAVFMVGVSAIKAMATWLVNSATYLSSPEQSQHCAIFLLWRARQPVPPLEPPPSTSTKAASGLILPRQLPLFG
jgi:hypothetical protein